MKGLETKAVITGIRAKQDGSLGLSVSTPELSVDEKVVFMSLQNLNVKLTIEPQTDQQVEKIIVEKGLEGKSLTERLYNVIYVYYKQTKSQDDFETFRRRNMESIIDQYKARLEPNN
jgi:hypothetical protein